MKTLLIFLSLSIALPGFAEDTRGAELLSYFQSNCRSSGEWTQLALTDSTALIETLRSISTDTDCKGISGSIANLNLLTRQLKNLQNVNDTQKKISEINFQEQELTIQLSKATKDDTKTEISDALRGLQVTRASYYAQEKAQKDLSDQSRVDAMNDVVQIANSTFTQLTANQRCLAKNPQILNTATSIMATVGATVSVVNPALGIGLSAGAIVLGTTVEGIRNLNEAHALKSITNYSTAYEGYKCAIETLSNRFCQMKDAQTFLNFKSSIRLQHINNNDLSQAIRLNDREIPVLLEWLNKIKSGVTPATSADASRQANVFDRENKVRSFNSYGVGVIEESRELFDLSQSRDERWNIIRSVITRLIPTTVYTSSGTSTSPFLDIYSAGYAPFYLLGLDDTADLQNVSSGDYYTLDTWPARKTYVPKIDVLKVRFLQWVDKTQKRVNQELTQVLQPDSEQTISSGFDRTGNRWKLSPMDSLKNIVTFLKKNPPRENNAAFIKVFQSTIKKLDTIYTAAQDYVISNANSESLNNISKSSIELIYETAQLQFGTVVLESRLDLIVRLSLLEMLQSSSSLDQTLVAQLLAADRFTETISKMSGTDNLALIQQDLQNAQPISISNLNAFSKLFGSNVTKILKKLYHDEAKNTGTVARANRNQRTQLCFLLLGVPNILEEVNVSYCEGLKLEALVPGGPATEVLNLSSFKKDLNERACTYSDFIRQNKIFEDWDIKL